MQECRSSCQSLPFFKKCWRSVLFSVGNKFSKGQILPVWHNFSNCDLRGCLTFTCALPSNVNEAHVGAAYCISFHRYMHSQDCPLPINCQKCLEASSAFQKCHLCLFLIICLPKHFACLRPLLLPACYMPNRLASVLSWWLSLPQLCGAFRYTSCQSISDHPVCIFPLPAHSSLNTEKQKMSELEGL